MGTIDSRRHSRLATYSLEDRNLHVWNAVGSQDYAPRLPLQDVVGDDAAETVSHDRHLQQVGQHRTIINFALMRSECTVMTARQTTAVTKAVSVSVRHRSPERGGRETVSGGGSTWNIRVSACRHGVRSLIAHMM